MDKLKTNYAKKDKLSASGVNHVTDTINEIIDETNKQQGTSMEKLTKTFVDGQPFYAADMNKFSETVNDVIDVLEGGGGDDTKWEIGDIVIYDSVDNKKIKSTVKGFSLDKYPESRYTAIGVIAFVMEDGSARMVALPAMSTDTPDTGSVENQSIYWGGFNVNIPGLTNYTRAASINHETGEVIDVAITSHVPSTGDQFGGVMSLDGVRVYYDTSSGTFLPSPYNADGTLNSAFTQSALTIGPLYCWSRDRNGKTYYMYTDTETPSSETILWCGTMGNPQYSQEKNYGTQSKIGENNRLATMLGSILDESVFDGGVEAFTSNFTAVPDSTYEETFLLVNSDMNGKANCTTILGEQTDYIYDKQQSGNPRYYWYRVNQSDGKRYFLYTDNDENALTVDTKIYIQGYSSGSFVKDYGTSDDHGSSTWYEIGTIGDGTKITGGVEGFTTNFTRVSQAAWRTAESLVNNFAVGNYPIATSTWRFHTPGTSQGDWYCPAAGELAMMISNFGQIQDALKKLKSVVSVPVACLRADGGCWSSSEVGSTDAWYYSNGSGNLSYNANKNYYYRVRAMAVVPALD